MNVKSKFGVFLLSATLLQPMVLLAADTETATNLSIKTAGDGTVTTVATNPNVSAPRTPMSTTVPALTGVTKMPPHVERPNNIRANGDLCDPGYYCVVPSGQYVLRTCFLGAGESRCLTVNTECTRLRAIRARNETLSRDDDQYYDHYCKTP